MWSRHASIVANGFSLRDSGELMANHADDDLLSRVARGEPASDGSDPWSSLAASEPDTDVPQEKDGADSKLALVIERLQHILYTARHIKQVIQKVGQTMAPIEALLPTMQGEDRPLLRGRRILVVDADEDIRGDAHNLLERYGCVVETAHDGAEALDMVRAWTEGEYDVIISDIRLPDINGYELLLKLQETRKMSPG